MDFSTIPIKRLIPQRPPFLLVDKVLMCDFTDAMTEFVVRNDNLLTDGMELSAPGLIENMAQSCAARMGCVDMLNNEPVKIGYIGDIRDADIIRLPHCGETLHTTIHVLQDMFNLLLAEVKVFSDSETVATGLFKVAKTDIIATLTD